MKLTPSESRLLDLIRAAGGTYCPGGDVTVTPEVTRILRRLERRGIIDIEQTDDGYRYSLTGGANG